jgi:hypothetical protein
MTAKRNIWTTAAMDIRPIKTEADYDSALAAVEMLLQAAPGSPEGDSNRGQTPIIRQAASCRLHSIGLARRDRQRARLPDDDDTPGGPCFIASTCPPVRPPACDRRRRSWSGRSLRYAGTDAAP